MVGITLDSVSVQFPIYDVNSRSLRNQLLKIGMGGRIYTDSRNHVVVSALEDISFSLREGDRVAIVGQNGAGKSTLLRALAGIYEPTRGVVRTYGRVAPLFDITLGMDPDATGYENIKIRGLLLGMRAAEIADHVDDIVNFSELGTYMDMPIRTYSTGMMVRLAFAIATIREPDILLMDEMIGAGDARFIHRAQERLHRFIGRAGILVLASHSEQVLRTMCTKGILLHHGKMIGFDTVDEILDAYKSITTAA